jgi:hypothetical protein
MQILSVSNVGYLSVIGHFVFAGRKLAQDDPRCFRAAAMT